MIKNDYVYAAKLIRVIDGDTIECDIDLGFYMTCRIAVRLAHINAPEMNTTEGHIAKNHLTAILADGVLVLRTFKPFDKYGRYLAEVFWDGENINEIMVKDGMAVPYEGGAR